MLWLVGIYYIRVIYPNCCHISSSHLSSKYPVWCHLYKSIVIHTLVYILFWSIRNPSLKIRRLAINETWVSINLLTNLWSTEHPPVNVSRKFHTNREFPYLMG